MKKTFNIYTDVTIRSGKSQRKSRTYILNIRRDSWAREVLMALKVMDQYGNIDYDFSVINRLILQNTCCKRAFLRGSFLAAGSISDPEKTYHFEMTCVHPKRAEQIRNVMETFGIEAKTVTRKRYLVVYLKEGSQIADMLNVMGAHVSLMDFENIRIYKDMRNKVNRKVNCETANINKTVSAAVKQVEDILYIKDHAGFSNLTEALKEMAGLRLEYPQASLVELGQMLSTPVGKSGVNHRLRKLSQIADDLRGNNSKVSKERQGKNYDF